MTIPNRSRKLEVCSEENQETASEDESYNLDQMEVEALRLRLRKA